MNTVEKFGNANRKALSDTNNYLFVDSVWAENFIITNLTTVQLPDGYCYTADGKILGENISYKIISMEMFQKSYLDRYILEELKKHFNDCRTGIAHGKHYIITEQSNINLFAEDTLTVYGVTYKFITQENFMAL